MNKKIFAGCAAVLFVIGALWAGNAEARPAAFPTARSTPKKKGSSSKSKSKKKGKTKVHGQMTPTSDRIRDIQSALQQQGALTGEPTGKWDDQTVGAMRSYQSSHGLNPSGKIDALTLQKLGLGSETAGRGAPLPPTPSAHPVPPVAE